MRRALNDVDLSAYALNELEPRRRRSVETRLAYDCEARQDIYAMQELASLLEEGFEREPQAFLTITQRDAIVHAEERWLRRRRAIRAVAMVAGLGAAAAIMLGLVQSGVIRLREPAATRRSAIQLPLPPSGSTSLTLAKGSRGLTLRDPDSDVSVTLDPGSHGPALPWPATIETSLRSGIPATVPMPAPAP